MNAAELTATILCIEDEEVLLEELVEELTSRGHKVSGARDADTGEKLIAQEQPDIVLCDVMMPGRNGFQLLNDLRARNLLPQQTAFIFLTALSDRGPHMTGLEAGATDYLTKPVDLDLLHLKIANILSFARRLGTGNTQAAMPVMPDIHLSPREEQVLALLGEGERTAAIAWKLGISEHTVTQYIKELYRKLGLSNRADAARMAIAMGLVKPGSN